MTTNVKVKEEIGIEITEEFPRFESMTEADNDRLEEFLERIIDGDDSVENELKTFQTKYPDVPAINNLLIMYYANTNKDKEAVALVEETYKKFPQDLMVRVQHTKLRMLDGDEKAFYEEFGGEIELEDIYPGRKSFQLTELMAFTCLVCDVCAMSGDFDLIREIREEFAEMDEEMPLLAYIDDLLEQEDDWEDEE